MVLILGSLTLVNAEDTDYELGDVNLDHTISVMDATHIQLHIAQIDILTQTQLSYADVDSSGGISVMDATIIQMFIAKIIDSLPYIPESTTDLVGYVDDENNITLSSSLPTDSYTLKYEDENGALSDYADICTLSVVENGEDITYTSFILQNKAPITATKIGVYNSNGERVGSIALNNSLIAPVGDKLYSFSALSDIHIGLNANNKEYYVTSTDDFIRALQYLNNDEKVDFNCICGDLTVYASEEELSYYKSIVDEYSKDTSVYVSAGNHEEYLYSSSGYLENYTGNPMYYYFTHNDDVYIIVGIMSSHEDRLFMEGELQWLYEVLEANRNKRCFVFEHILTKEGSGDALNLLTSCKLSDYKTSVAFKNLLSHYQNVIHFHGHSHMEFGLQQYSEDANYDNVFSRHSVHIPSLSVPRGVDESGSLKTLFEKSEGYVVDVYENGVYLRGRDFVNGKYLPIAQYYLDTTIKTIEPNTFVDNTGIIDTSVTTQ